MTVTILTGDCRDILKTLPSDSVHCCVCSPPYWGLRSYGVGTENGELGLEPSLADYVAGMVEVFREVRRVLRKDGTLWLNLGDSYATQVNGRSAHDTKLKGNDDRTFRDKPFSTITADWKSRVGQSGNKGNPGADHHFRVSDPILKPKDLCGIPWRVAFALQESGWYLRSDIIWAKSNPMPESVTDRPTKSHEYLFLLSKSERYFYDAEAIREPVSPNTHARLSQDIANQVGSARANGGAKTNGPMKAVGQYPKTQPAGQGIKNNESYSAAVCLQVTHRNKRTVWTTSTEAFSEAHFATFPPALIEPCILAGCPKGATVLDPFGGAGTTGMVADRLGRNAILIELNPAYAEMSRRRIQDDAGMFAEINQGPPRDDYDAQSDIEGSFSEAYRVIRERKAAGGPGWEPKS